MVSDGKELELGDPDLLWSPTSDDVQASVLRKYSDWLNARLGLAFANYEEMWRWSVDDLSAFWLSVWDFFDVIAEGRRDPVLGRSEMPGAEWFPNARLNYAEQVFQRATTAWPAMIVRNEEGEREVTWAELHRSTATLAKRFRDLGVGPGDRIAAYLRIPTMPPGYSNPHPRIVLI